MKTIRALMIVFTPCPAGLFAQRGGTNSLNGCNQDSATPAVAVDSSC